MVTLALAFRLMFSDVNSALELAHTCKSPTSWAQRVRGDYWRAVCGDDNGRPIPYGRAYRESAECIERSRLSGGSPDIDCELWED